mmetsp:Transcript_49840/g.138449  ORF Transcript_49840/g.138449 Transcript_49840/m.138449 type:complete len:206 (-) Transcript_49840:337-954(-)
MLPMTVHGIVPKMPCMIITQKVGMERNLHKSLISSKIAQRALQRRPSACDESLGASRTGGSCKNLPMMQPTAIARTPMMPKATRQPFSPKMVFLDILPTIMVDRNIPTSREHCTRPKILPRRPSDVTSAMMPLEIGLRAANSEPTTARRTIMAQSDVVVARAMVTRPWPKEPMTRMDRRRKMRRSARMPQRGAARLMHTPCATVR